MSIRRILFLTPAHAVTRIFPQLRDEGYEIGIAENLKGASVFIRKSGPGVIFARPSLPGFRVEDLLAVGADDPQFPPVVVVTDKPNAEEAEQLLSLGAQDYWVEPLDLEKVVAMARAPRTPLAAPASSTLGGRKPVLPAGGPNIVGTHPSVHRVLHLARQVAPSKATVLISGESGTGKELFARCLHAWSGRAGGPFVAVNCAALPEHLLESELFGHEKGSFTGAIGRKLGKFELANGGTILLDEISEMDLALQAKMLRVLQEGEIDRVGGSETVRVDVRVLATTNRDLEAWVREGKFRQDLYFRLNVIPLRLPSLRERGNDVLELARFFLSLYVRDYGLPATQLSEEAVQWLLAYDFPGNVRELQNLMERAALLANGHPIESGHFLLDPDAWPLFEDEQAAGPNADDSAQDSASAALSGVDIRNAGSAGSAGNAGSVSSGSMPGGLPDFGGPGNGNAQKLSGPVIPLHEMERIMILKGLDVTSGNRTQAAEILGISVRTLRNKLNEYRAMGITVE